MSHANELRSKSARLAASLKAVALFVLIGLIAATAEQLMLGPDAANLASVADQNQGGASIAHVAQSAPDTSTDVFRGP